jgi:ferrous iron transport protein B
MALLVSYVAKWFIKIKERSFFILELPTYRQPRWNNVAQTMLSKAKIFVRDAGKVIMVISLILWALSSYGPGRKMEVIDKQFQNAMQANGADADALEREHASARLEKLVCRPYGQMDGAGAYASWL